MRNSSFIHIVVLVLLSFFAGCEEERLLDNNIRYEEYIVVRAELVAGEEFEGVQVRKTIPFDQAYNISTAEIKNMTGFIRIDDVQVVPIHYEGYGMYLPLYPLIVESGKTYELVAEVGEKLIYAKTTVPEVPIASNISLHKDYYYYADIKPKRNTVFGALWEIRDEDQERILYSAEDFFEVVFVENIKYYESLFIRTMMIPENLRTSHMLELMTVRFYAYDRPYMDYFQTRLNNRPIENSFAQGGGTIAWNVYGENVIGLFIGSAASNPRGNAKGW